MLHFNKSIVLIKPCAFSCKIEWELVQKLLHPRMLQEQVESPWTLESMRYLEYPSRSLIRQHYYDHLDQPYYKRLEKHMLSGPILAMLMRSEMAMLRLYCLDLRQVYGNPEPPATLIHCSDSIEAGIREANVWFTVNLH